MFPPAKREGLRRKEEGASLIGRGLIISILHLHVKVNLCWIHSDLASTRGSSGLGAQGHRWLIGVVGNAAMVKLQQGGHLPYDFIDFVSYRDTYMMEI